MDMIEKVARAIAGDVHRFDSAGKIVPCSWEEADHLLREVNLKRARAAIEAMREPTEEMCQAGNDTGAVANDDFWISNHSIATVYEAMIDAALTPSPASK